MRRFQCESCHRRSPKILDLAFHVRPFQRTSRPSLRNSPASQQPGLLGCRDCHHRARDRREYGHVQLCEWRVTQSLAISRIGPHRAHPRKASHRRAQWHLHPELSRLDEPECRLRVHGRGSWLACHVDRWGRAGLDPRRARLGALLRYLRSEASAGPHVSSGRGPARQRSCRAAEPCALGKPLRFRSRNAGTGHLVERRGTHRDRRPSERRSLRSRRSPDLETPCLPAFKHDA